MNYARFKIATFNASNLVLPNVVFYGDEKYTDRRYDQKLDWMSDQLIRMDADIVCFQEVFHQEALQQLADTYHDKIAKIETSEARLAKLRYNTVLHHECGSIDPTHTGPSPGLGMLARYTALDIRETQDVSDNPISIAQDDGMSFTFTKLSRPVAAVTVDVEGNPLRVVNAHLKSKRPSYLKLKDDDGQPILDADGSAVYEPASDRSNLMFYERSLASLRSQIRRSAEGAHLRRLIVEEIRDNQIPLVLCGDLNDDFESTSTQMIAGEELLFGGSSQLKRNYWDVKLYSASKIHTQRSELSDYYSYIYDGHHSTIDHIMISEEFYYRNPRAPAALNYVQALNDHLVDRAIFSDRPVSGSSDHGQMVATLTFLDLLEVDEVLGTDTWAAFLPGAISATEEVSYRKATRRKYPDGRLIAGMVRNNDGSEVQSSIGYIVDSNQVVRVYGVPVQ